MSLKWSATLETGYSEIDEQHKHMFNDLRNVIAAVKEGRAQPLVSAALANVEDYVARHFELEESLMETFSYPELAKHRADHKEFHEELLHIGEMYRKNGHSALITIKLQTCVVRWMHEHIKGSDKKLVNFLKKIEPAIAAVGPREKGNA
jgi:hemerythrin